MSPLNQAQRRRLYQSWGRQLPQEIQSPNGQQSQQLFLEDVEDVQDSLREAGFPALENPKSIAPIEYQGGSLVSPSARTGGTYILAHTRWGKSRLTGRGICYTDLLNYTPTVVIDSIGATIDNLLDKVCYVKPQAKQLALFDRIKYCNMSGERINGHTYVTSWPMLERRSPEEDLHTTSQRYIDLVEKTERYFSQASIMGMPRFRTILTNISLVLGALGLPLDSALDLLDHPEEWQEYLRRLEQHPEVGFAARDLQTFFKQNKRERDQYTEPLKNRLSFLRHSLAAREMFAGSKPPTIQWDDVLKRGQTVLLDFRGQQPDYIKHITLFWVWEAIREMIGTRTRNSPPLSLVIDELAFFVLGQNLNTEKIATDFHELIIRKGNVNLWLTVATQNQEQLPDVMRAACLEIESIIFGAAKDLKTAGEFAAKWYVKDPNRVKHWRKVWGATKSEGGYRGGPRTTTYSVIDYEPVFSPLEEQQYENARKFLDQGKGEGLFAQSQYEGHMPDELLPITVNTLDPGKYVNEELVAKARQRLMKQDGVPVSGVATEFAPPTLPAPVEAAGAKVLQPEGENGRNRQQHPQVQQQSPGREASEKELLSADGHAGMGRHRRVSEQ